MIMELHLHDVESSFTRVNTCNFRTILSQEDANAERVTEAASDDGDESALSAQQEN